MSYFSTDGKEIRIRPLHRDEIEHPHIELFTMLPNVRIRDLENQLIPMWEIKEKNKPLIMALWYENCSDCHSYLKQLDDLRDEYGDLVTVAGLNISDRPNSIISFNQELGICLPQYAASFSLLAALGNYGHFPSAVVFDDNGNLVGNSLTINELENYIENLPAQNL